MSICGSNTAVKREGSRHTYISLPCNSWHCEHCQPKRLKEVRAQSFAGAPDMFLTFTIRPDGRTTPEQAILKLTDAFRKLRLKILRRNPQAGFPFMAFVERHQSGYPHLHILARSRFIPHKWISNQMRAYINSPVVSIERLHTKSKKASYCSSYSSKCLQKVGTAKRYWKSKDYDLRDKDELEKYKKGKKGWFVSMLKLATIRRTALDTHAFIYIDEPGRLVLDWFPP